MKIVIGIFLILILVLMTTKIKVNIPYLSKGQKSLKIDFNVRLGIYLFGFIKIIGITMKNDSMRFLFLRIPYSIFKIDKNSLKKFKDFSANHLIRKLNIKFEKVYIDLTIGMEDAMVNALLVGFLSSILSSLAGIKSQKFNLKKYYYKIVPVYNSNILRFNCMFTFSMKLTDMLKVFLFVKKIDNIKNTSFDTKPTPIKI